MTVWVCVAALALLDKLDLVDRDLLGAWLSERQLPNGGLNGRPEKLEDVSFPHISLTTGMLFMVGRSRSEYPRPLTLDQQR